jgi:hypothetical protein
MMRVNIFDEMMRRVTLSFAMAYHNDSATSRHRGFSAGKGKSMSDVQKEIDELQCKLTARTREIEALVAEELNLGDINAMEDTAYARLRSYVEQLIEKWQQADVDHPGSNPDTAVNRLIAEREEIEEQIITLQVR